MLCAIGVITSKDEVGQLQRIDWLVLVRLFPLVGAAATGPRAAHIPPAGGIATACPWLWWDVGRRTQRFLAEAAKFLTVGGVATLVSFVLFNGLVHGFLRDPGPMHEQPLGAFVLANTVGMVVSYRGSRSWAFRNREAVGVAGGRVAFVVINLASMVIPLTCLAFTRYVLGRSDPVADNIAANVVGLGLGTLARFWAIRRFIFVARRVEDTVSSR